ncbi:Holliday junction branch migration protein RuvA [Rothia aerolata]|uniref:Holliday junction branch migration complex subunit RuvA n=1 Tax=Rothia aerolata TaxID=1812262 RepID=A0A917ILE6_9MICC|nr:Holliday junction branch migration protein RuvA [Rothia aerolata]GGH57888.1 Holliday junction ATP-dependent DNA helicase RuvA [Rothia aerolata]
MISSLTGQVTHVGLDNLMIDVNGFGMFVNIPGRTAAALRVGEQRTILTTMIVREDSMTLYGFLDSAEREVFDLMLTVSGIGPRIALAVVSALTPAEVSQAVAVGDDKAFTKVPGIGPKGARRVVLELAGKLVLADSDTSDQLPLSHEVAWKPQVLDALMGLGWTEKDSLAAVDSFIKENPAAENLSVAQALKSVLATLGSQHSNTRH